MVKKGDGGLEDCSREKDGRCKVRYRTLHVEGEKLWRGLEGPILHYPHPVSGTFCTPVAGTPEKKRSRHESTRSSRVFLYLWWVDSRGLFRMMNIWSRGSTSGVLWTDRLNKALQDFRGV